VVEGRECVVLYQVGVSVCGGNGDGPLGIVAESRGREVGVR